MNNSIPIPEGLKVITDWDILTIRKTWLGWSIIPTAIFTAVWDSFLVFWYMAALNSPKVPWIMVVFPIGHVAVGVGLTYYVLSCLVNRTDVIISPYNIKVCTYPLPWLSNREVPREDILDVILRPTGEGQRGSAQIIYVGPDNREKKLVTNIARYEEAEYIIHQIEYSLKIKRKEANIES